MKCKYTVIFIESWMAGSHRFSVPHFRRIERIGYETVKQMLEREGILEETVYLFEGHPKLEGEYS